MGNRKGAMEMTNGKGIKGSDKITKGKKNLNLMNARVIMLTQSKGMAEKVEKRSDGKDEW